MQLLSDTELMNAKLNIDKLGQCKNLRGNICKNPIFA